MKTTEVRFAATAGDWRTGEIRVEGGSFFLASNTIYPPHTALSLVLTLPGERRPVRISVEVTAARVSEPSGMAVSFVSETPAEEKPARERLERALATRPVSPSHRS